MPFIQWHNAQKNAKEAAQQSVNALAQTSEASLFSNQQLEALVFGIQAGRQLKDANLEQGAGSQAVSVALQRAVYNVQERNRLEGDSTQISSVSFSPDGKILASASADKTVKLWDVATGREIKTIEGHSNSVWSVSFSLDGKTLASASGDTTVKLWDVATGKEFVVRYTLRNSIVGALALRGREDACPTSIRTLFYSFNPIFNLLIQLA